MRISKYKDDPGYSPHFVGCGLRGVRIYVDGQDVSGTVVVADDVEGVVVRYLRPLRVNATRDDAESETLRGVVRIVIPEGDPLAKAGS